MLPTGIFGGAIAPPAPPPLSVQQHGNYYDQQSLFINFLVCAFIRICMFTQLYEPLDN